MDWPTAAVLIAIVFAVMAVSRHLHRWAKPKEIDNKPTQGM